MGNRKGFIYSEQLPMFGHKDVIGYGNNEFYVKEIDKQKSKDLIIKNHYSHKVCNDATTHIHLGVYIDNELIGCLQYGYAMNPRSCNTVVKGTELNQYKELNRMWLDDKAPRNSESKAISYSIKYIKKKFKTVKWIQSFADERCGGLGIVYQACSFRFYGEHTSIFWEFENETYHNSLITNNNRNKKAELIKRGFKEKAIKHQLRQFRYIKFLDQSWVSKCTKKEQPYLKHYNND
jgi:hypothetical protein